MSIEQTIQTKLKPVPSGTPGEWSAWEHKTLNMHRGVLHWRAGRRDITISELGVSVRDMAAQQFRVAWWRGFGFGVLVDISRLPEDIESIGECIDATANSKGTWQWLMVASDEAKAVIAMHTWVQGYLTPVYSGLLRHYETSGFAVKSFKKDKGKLFRLFLGTAPSRFMFPEFEVEEPGT